MHTKSHYCFTIDFERHDNYLYKINQNQLLWGLRYMPTVFSKQDSHGKWELF